MHIKTLNNRIIDLAAFPSLRVTPSRNTEGLEIQAWRLDDENHRVLFKGDDETVTKLYDHLWNALSGGALAFDVALSLEMPDNQIDESAIARPDWLVELGDQLQVPTVPTVQSGADPVEDSWEPSIYDAHLGDDADNVITQLGPEPISEDKK